MRGSGSRRGLRRPPQNSARSGECTALDGPVRDGRLLPRAAPQYLVTEDGASPPIGAARGASEARRESVPCHVRREIRSIRSCSPRQARVNWRASGPTDRRVSGPEVGRQRRRRTRTRLSTRGGGVKARRGMVGPSDASIVRCHRVAPGAASDDHLSAAWAWTTRCADVSRVPRWVSRRRRGDVTPYGTLATTPNARVGNRRSLASCRTTVMRSPYRSRRSRARLG